LARAVPPHAVGYGNVTTGITGTSAGRSFNRGFVLLNADARLQLSGGDNDEPLDIAKGGGQRRWLAEISGADFDPLLGKLLQLSGVPRNRDDVRSRSPGKRVPHERRAKLTARAGDANFHKVASTDLSSPISSPDSGSPGLEQASALLKRKSLSPLTASR
jgi:hypothetical protein